MCSMEINTLRHFSTATSTWSALFMSCAKGVLLNRGCRRWRSFRSLQTPTLDYTTGIQSVSSTSERCSRDGRRGRSNPRQCCTPRHPPAQGLSNMDRCVKRVNGMTDTELPNQNPHDHARTCLGLNRGLVKLVSADCAGVRADVPGPKCHGVPGDIHGYNICLCAQSKCQCSMSHPCVPLFHNKTRTVLATSLLVHLHFLIVRHPSCITHAKSWS